MAGVGFCGLFCSLLCHGLIIGFGIAYVIEAGGFINAPGNVWVWAIVTIILNFIAAVNWVVKFLRSFFGEDVDVTVSFSKEGVVHVTRAVRDNINYFDAFLFVSGLASVIWGCVIYAQRGEIADIYPEHLWTWFAVVFIFDLCLWSCLGCCLCCIGVCLGGAAGTIATRREDAMEAVVESGFVQTSGDLPSVWIAEKNDGTLDD